MASDSSNLIATPPEPTTSPWRRQLVGTLFGQRRAGSADTSGSRGAGRGIYSQNARGRHIFLSNPAISMALKLRILSKSSRDFA